MAFFGGGSNPFGGGSNPFGLTLGGDALAPPPIASPDVHAQREADVTRLAAVKLDDMATLPDDSISGLYIARYMKKFFYVRQKRRGGGGAEKGLKIHIPVKYDGNIQKAYDALLPILIRHGICTTKFSAPRSDSPTSFKETPEGMGAFSENFVQEGAYKGFQHGKAICIYVRSFEVDWQRVFSEIETALDAVGVELDSQAPRYRYTTRVVTKNDAGAEVVSYEGHFSRVEETRIKGSKYCFYEDDSLVFNDETDFLTSKKRINADFDKIVIAPSVASASGSSAGLSGGSGVDASVAGAKRSRASEETGAEIATAFGAPSAVVVAQSTESTESAASASAAKKARGDAGAEGPPA